MYAISMMVVKITGNNHLWLLNPPLPTKNPPSGVSTCRTHVGHASTEHAYLQIKN